MRTYFLLPTGPLAVAGGALNGALPRSDTVSAALVSVWRHVAPDTDVDALAASPPFRVSSALPWIQSGDGTRDLYLPLPAGLLDATVERTPHRRKRLKRISYATAEAIRRLLAQPEWDVAQVDTPAGVLLGHRPAGSTPRQAGFLDVSRRLRVAVDRLGDGPLEGMLFDEESARFAPGCGFALMAEVQPDAIPAFESALELLGLEGIGSERTTGHGGFRVERVEEASAPGFGTGRRLLLSLYHPTAAEVTAGVLGDDAAYSVIERSGWITAPTVRPLRRRPVRMLAEGSLVCDVDGQARLGDVLVALPPDPELGLDFPVYRDGRAVTVPFPAGEASHG